MTTSTLPAPVGSAVTADAADTGRRFAFRQTVPGLGTLTFAKDDGPGTIVEGLPIFKAGTFNGWTFDEADLVAIVERFGQLHPATFTPPFRVDHGWSAYDVVGWFEALRLETRRDMSVGGEGVDRTMVVADVRFVDDVALTALRSGKFRNVSSELGPYITNDGREFSLVCWGCAFVDIPAVEGLDLSALKFTRDRKADTVTVLNAEQTPTDPPAEPPAEGDAAPEATGTDAPSATDDAPAGTDADAEAEGDEDVEGEPAGDGDGDDEPPASDDTPPAELRAAGDRVAALRAAGFTAEADELVRLHRDAVDRDVAHHRSRGVVNAANEQHVRALLEHSDAGVRDAARATLAALTPPVQLGAEDGTLQPLPRPAAAHTAGRTSAIKPDELAALSRDEFGPAWQALTPEQRASDEYRAAYDTWRQAQLA